MFSIKFRTWFMAGSLRGYGTQFLPNSYRISATLDIAAGHGRSPKNARKMIDSRRRI